MENKVKFQRFGTMVDCSRNAVMKVDSLKKWIGITSDLGYNALLLYTEDTYEVDDNPYFGYMRGRYSKEELKEINAYALSKGMELIPCIQTLAHLNAIVAWPDYRPHVDVNDILLVGDEKVYELIDKMFATIAECYTTKVVNIGMDEAHMLGRGKYYDLHGEVNRFQIFVEHLKRVAQIADKYGFTLEMWSDMFFRLATGGKYESEDVSKTQISEEVTKQIPGNVQLIYWDYYHDDKIHYDNMIRAHEKMKKGTGFAGGLYAWNSIAPYNEFSLRTLVPGLQSCMDNGVQNVFLTIWGDDGAECSKYAMLPALFYASEIAKGNNDADDIKVKFEEKFGISYDTFMLLDLPDSPRKRGMLYNPEKYLFYNDCFTGLLDSTIAGGENATYAHVAEQLSKAAIGTEWRYLFETQEKLCAVLSIKAELGRRTREVYQSRDREVLVTLIQDYRTMLQTMQDFYYTYRKQWFTDNKPHGFDVQDIRIGGVIRRVQSCMERLQELYDGTIDRIEELEEVQLDFCGARENLAQEITVCGSWKRAITTNVL